LLTISCRCGIAEEMREILKKKWTNIAEPERPKNLKDVINLPVFWDNKTICLLIVSIASSLHQSKEMKSSFAKKCRTVFKYSYFTH